MFPAATESVECDDIISNAEKLLREIAVKPALNEPEDDIVFVGAVPKETAQAPPQESVKMLNLGSNLAKKKHNSRLNRITNVLLEKLQKDGPVSLEPPQEESDDQDENEPGFQIVNVVGGYKSPEHEAEDAVIPKVPSVIKKKKKVKKLTNQLISNISNRDTTIKPTKTNDVTKIKGWKKKKFITESNLESTATVTKSPKASVSNSSANAAFTSDILDQFLSENSNLNISYELPKLVAEDTLKQTYIDVQFPTYEQVATSHPPKPKTEGFKPKTVAEKRRLEEMKLNPFANILEKMSTREQKQCVRETLKIKRKLVSQDLPFTRRCFVTAVRLTRTESAVLYGANRLYVPSSKENKILENVKDESRKRFRAAKIKPKPSLLRTLSYNFTYDPKEWKNVRLKLPKLFVEVTPQLRKRIHPRVERYVQYDKEVLDEDRVAFALSTLKVKGQPFVPQTFVFPVRYKKTKVFKKRKELKPLLSASTCDESDDLIESGVKEVIERLLDYCERLEETKDIVLEDEVRVVEEKELVAPDAVDKVANAKSASPTLKKTEAEMKRLNCKFLSIPTNDDVSSAGPCQKEHCALGCVCRHYSTLLDQNHCGQYKCMFECICENRSKSFSQSVINRLQDEAKKNLAKEEKEFTQTLIKTNNQFILVEDSERRKRKAKIPRRYDDFIESEESDRNVTHPKPVRVDLPKPKVEPPLLYGDMIIPWCHVRLMKYDFDDIIPYCMVHSLYKCYCRKQAPLSKTISPIKPTLTTEAPRIATDPKENVAVVRKLEQTNVIEFQGIKINSLEHQKITSVVPFKESSSNSRNRMKKKNKVSKLYREDHTAKTSRIKGVSLTLLYRNKSSTHLAKIRKSTREFELQLHAYIVENVDSILQQSETSETESNLTVSHQDCDLTLVETSKPPVQETEVENPKQEKVGAKELKLQRRRRKQKLTQKSDDHKTKEEMETEYLKFLGKYNSKTRMLPWSQLMAKFESGDYQLWYRLCRESSLVTLTENDKSPSPFHINLQSFLKYDRKTLPLERYGNVVKYIIKRQTPSGIPKENILALVLETKGGIWNICGLCEKNQTSNTGQFTASIIEFYDGVQEIMNDDGREKQIGKTTKKDVSMCRKVFTTKSLIPENDMENKDKILEAQLPDLPHSSKWLVVPFKTIFSQLCFTRCNFSVGFDDITKATTVACSHLTTVALKSNRLKRTYTHIKFGVYYDPTNSDKLFIGPYVRTENHDVKFMHYVNSSLVEVDGFFENSSTGATHWYRAFVEVSDGDDDVEFIPTSESLIDLTCDDSENEDSSHNPNELDIKKCDTQLDDHTQICDYYKPVGDPRYIVTNIPEIGYLPAYLHGDSLDVVLCPVSKTPRRFSNWKIALNLIQRVMAVKITLVPSDFKLVVTMLIDLDKSKYKLLNKNILNGFYMAGAFGVRCFGNITPTQLNLLDLSQEEKTRMLLLRERKYKQVLVMQLIKSLNLQVPQGITGGELLKFVASEAEVEKKKLERESGQYADEFKALENTKRALVEKYKTLISALPETRQKIAEKQLDNILKSSPVKDQMRHVRIVNGDIINLDLEDEPNTFNCKEEDGAAIETIKPSFIIKDITRATVVDTSVSPLTSPIANKTPAFVNLTLKKKYSNVSKSPQQTFKTVPHFAKIGRSGTSASSLTSLNSASQMVIAAGNTSVIPTSSALHSIEKQSVPSMATLTALSATKGSNYIALQNGNKVNLLKLDSNNLSLITKPNTSTSLIKSPSSVNR